MLPYRFEPGRIYRRPTHFGPAPGPREIHAGMIAAACSALFCRANCYVGYGQSADQSGCGKRAQSRVGRR
jgi:hypothetical protein